MEKNAVVVLNIKLCKQIKQTDLINFHKTMCWTLKCKIDIKHFSVKTKARTRNFFLKTKALQYERAKRLPQRGGR